MDPALAACARHGRSSASLSIDGFQQIELPVVAFFVVYRSKMETRLQQKRNVVVLAVFTGCSSPFSLDVAKNFSGRSKIKLRMQQKRRRRLHEVAAPPYIDVAKKKQRSSKILLRLQQNTVVVVARSELRLMDVGKSFAGSSKIQLWLQLPLVVQCH